MISLCLYVYIALSFLAFLYGFVFFFGLAIVFFGEGFGRCFTLGTSPAFSTLGGRGGFDFAGIFSVAAGAAGGFGLVILVLGVGGPSEGSIEICRSGRGITWTATTFPTFLAAAAPALTAAVTAATSPLNFTVTNATLVISYPIRITSAALAPASAASMAGINPQVSISPRLFFFMDYPCLSMLVSNSVTTKVINSPN